MERKNRPKCSVIKGFVFGIKRAFGVFVLISVLYFFCFSLASAQNNLHFEHLNSNNGLSNNSVLSIVQDSSGFIWIGTRFGLNRYDTRNIKTFLHEEGRSGISANDYLNAMLVDHKGQLWVGTASGLNRYRADLETFEVYDQKQKGRRHLSDNSVLSLAEDPAGNLWVGTKSGINVLSKRDTLPCVGLENRTIYALKSALNGGIWASTDKGLFRLQINGRQIDALFFLDLSTSLGLDGGESHIAAILEEPYGKLWLGTDKTGLFLYDMVNKSLKHFNDKNDHYPDLGYNVRKIVRDHTGKLWIGTLKGLITYDNQSRRFRHYTHDPADPSSLSHNSIYEIFEDTFGSIWIGTYYGGVDLAYPKFTNFETYGYHPDGTALNSSIIGAIGEDAEGNLWIGTEEGGLNYFNRKTGRFQYFGAQSSNGRGLNSNLIKSLFIDGQGKVWVGTYQGGLNYYDPDTRNFRYYTYDERDSSSIRSNYVCALLEDSQQRFWVGTGRGLLLFDRKKGRFSGFSDNQYCAEGHGLEGNIVCIREDQEQTLWVAAGGGAYFLRKGSRSFQSVFPTEKDINFVVKDKKGRVWIGAYYDGLWQYDEDSRKLQAYHIKDGLASENVLGLLQDDEGLLWLSTAKGLCSFDPDNKYFRTYTTSDGLPSNDFNYNSFFRDSQGKLFFGSYNGLVSFNPKQIKQNAYQPALQIVGLKLFNQEVEIGGQDGLLSKSLMESELIAFTHDQNVFSIEFAVLNYIKPEKNHYAFMLEGFDKEWNYVQLPTATYTNLPPGDYTFKAKGTNNDGFWSTPRSIRIRVLPPFWKTWWAYLVYAVVIAAVFFVFLRFLVMRALLRREHEVNQMKLNFFTNVSHEIRTPLTLITAPLERLVHQTMKGSFFQEELLGIKNNADRLLRLINELMDFRKAESGFMKLHISEQDVITFVRAVYLSFEEVAVSKKIKYRLQSPTGSVPLFFDRIQFEKVLFNLLANAFKFTPERGEIIIHIEDRENDVLIRVSDTGPGIGMEEQKKLFTNFYQVQRPDRHHIGSGVGLALSKNIMDLHGGNIVLDGTDEYGLGAGYTTFMVGLRKGKSHFDKHKVVFDEAKGEQAMGFYYPDSFDDQLTNDNKKGNKNYTLLIVEDNEELRKFIARTLSDDFNILEAINGEDAFKVAIQDLPDLVISDVMMPVMDGLTLCRYLKTDERTSHIPVILLTARAAYEQHVNGLKTGADLYMVKPFGAELLRLNALNLIVIRQALREKYAQMVKLEPTDQPIDNVDKVFLDKLIRILEDKMENSDFDVPALADQIGMSQPVLYKKVRALTNLTVNEFIKSIRLKRAAQLFNQGQMSIAEVAYTVGFNDRKYFSKEFKKQFGKTPTDYLQEASSC